MALLVIAHRYREGSDPLARDAARGWRTGRVLDGNFDLLAAALTS